MAKSKTSSTATLPVAQSAPDAPVVNGAAPANGVARTKCPVTREQFAEGARQVTITIDGNTMIADPREFSTGSLGWYANGKTVIDVGGVRTTVQVGLSLTVVGSKELPK